MHRSRLVELEVVMAVVRRGSFRAAAEELGISTTAASSAIAGLESRLQARLFNRTTRSVALTEAGKNFVERIGPALMEIRRATEEVNSSSAEPTGILRINAPPESGPLFFERIVIPYLQCYPQMRVEIAEQARLIDIVAEGFDAGIRLAESVPQDMISVPLTSDLRQIAVASPDYLAKYGTPKTPEALKQHQGICMRFSNGSIYRWELERHGEYYEVDIIPRLVLPSMQARLEAVRAGLGIAFINESQIKDDLASGCLIPILADWCQAFKGLCLYYPGHRYVPAGLKALVATIRARKP
ncbi:LysR family transcriptional regulator [Yersinia enterocolitica]|uniref:LysR family transcriptional regulator n=1 Tax=Yersinia enterocolitica TaxID=630 RepID=UPI001C8DC494|nr:LysR family transcriptional regulator [Yersinia enterocolitica]MBX9498267.1 LysR family transcriptional regulator [Yersinia enterocolitica]